MTDSTKAPKTTSAQRQAALRQRARSLAYGLDDAQIRTAPDTAILEAVAIAFRNRQSAVLEDLAVELLLRLGRHVKIIPVDPSSVTVTPDSPVSTVTVTQTETTPGTKTRRGYPVEVQRLAVDMADQGKSSREIQAAITAMVGRAPDTRNVAKIIRRWRSAIG
jgi:hypothetical protein